MNIYEILTQKIDKSQILIDEPMSRHTSFKIGGPADFFVKTKEIGELKYILEIAKEYVIGVTVIGNGTNLLVKDRWYKGYCNTNMF